jgi:hypothetical protein
MTTTRHPAYARPTVLYSETSTARLLGCTVTALDAYRVKGTLHAIDRHGVLMYDSAEVIAELRARRERLNASVVESPRDPLSGGRALVYGIALGAAAWAVVLGTAWLVRLVVA